MCIRDSPQTVGSMNSFRTDPSEEPPRLIEDETDYLPDASCPRDGAPATRPAFVGLLLAFLAFRIYLY